MSASPLGQSQEMVFQRVAIVDEMMRTKGWNLSVVNELALTLGVDRRTVYRLRAMAVSWTQKHLRPTDMERWRQEQLVLADSAARAAVAKGDYSGAAALLKVAGQLAGTITTPGTKVDINLNSFTVTQQAAIATIAGRDRALLADKVDAADARKLAIDATFEATDGTDEPTR